MLGNRVGCSPDVVECGDSSPPFASSGDESPHSTSCHPLAMTA